MTFLGRVPERELTKVRGRIADVLNILRESGLITWPPEKPKEKKAPLTAEYKAMKKKLAVQAKRPLSELQLGEVDDLITGMADVARTEGIMALDTIVSTAGDRFLGTGFRLAIDGTEPELALNILESYTESLLREHASKLRKVLEGVMSIQSGDNPRIVEQKVKAIY
jgi:flagellar motor component MotA